MGFNFDREGRRNRAAHGVELQRARAVVCPYDKARGRAAEAYRDHMRTKSRRGEAIVTRNGLEGGVVYALSAAIRAALAAPPATLSIDLKPDADQAALAARLANAPPKDSLANVLRKSAGLSPAAAALVREAGPVPHDPAGLAARIRSVPLAITGVAGLERAISTAGGIRAEALDATLMLRALPGVFAAGEMLDFDAPTGGYLLQAAFATADVAARGIDSILTRCPATACDTRAPLGP